MADYFYPVNDILMRLNELGQSEMCECFNFGKFNRTIEFDKINEPEKACREMTFQKGEVELVAECFNHELVLTFNHKRQVKEHEQVTKEFTDQWNTVNAECVSWVTGLFQEVTVVKFTNQK
jgi:hypothetical protein